MRKSKAYRDYLHESKSLSAIEKARIDFVESMARQLMAEHGLHDLRFEYRSYMLRMGVYDYSGEIPIIAIDYGHALKSDLERVRDTILHEIAHALTPGCGHRLKWQEMPRSLGGEMTKVEADRYHK